MLRRFPTPLPYDSVAVPTSVHLSSKGRNRFKGPGAVTGARAPPRAFEMQSASVAARVRADSRALHDHAWVDQYVSQSCWAMAPLSL